MSLGTNRIIRAYHICNCRILWKNLEGKTIHHLTQTLNNPVIKDKDRDDQIERIVSYLTISKVTLWLLHKYNQLLGKTRFPYIEIIL